MAKLKILFRISCIFKDCKDMISATFLSIFKVFYEVWYAYKKNPSI